MSKAQQEIATPDNMNTQSRKVRSQKPNFGTTRWITYTALFCAMAIVMKLIGQVLTLTPSFKMSLLYVIWLIAAAVLGPSGGAIVGCVSDTIGSIIIPGLTFNPLLTICYTLYGFVAGLAFKIPFKHYATRFVISWLICTVLFTCLLCSLSLWYSYGYYHTLSFWQYFISNRLMQIAIAAINLGVTLAMIPLLSKLRLLPKINNKETRLCRISQSKC